MKTKYPWQDAWQTLKRTIEEERHPLSEAAEPNRHNK